MSRAVLVTLLAGCNSIYGLEHTTAADAFTFEPPNCPTIRFGPPLPLLDYNGGDEYDGQLSLDGRELWFTLRNSAGAIDLFRGVKSDSGTFDIKQVTFPNLPNMFDPSLTADGRRLMFIASGNNNGDVYEAVRSDPSSATFQVRAVVGLLNFSAGYDGLDLSWDGLRLYYTGDGHLYVTERPGRDDPFGYSTQLLMNDPVEFVFPSVSPDELEIFYNHAGDAGGRLYYRNRDSKAAAFGPEQIVLDEGADPDIAPGSDKLVVSRAKALFVLERVCGQ